MNLKKKNQSIKNTWELWSRNIDGCGPFGDRITTVPDPFPENSSC